MTDITFPPFEQQIDDIMHRFNFERVLRIMHMDDWKWRGRTVTRDDLESTAFQLLDGAVQSYRKDDSQNAMWATGGFTARVEKYPNGGRVSLLFSIESVEAYMF